jgi:hypothetical protein
MYVQGANTFTPAQEVVEGHNIMPLLIAAGDGDSFNLYFDGRYLSEMVISNLKLYFT